MLQNLGTVDMLMCKLFSSCFSPYVSGEMHAELTTKNLMVTSRDQLINHVRERFVVPAILIMAYTAYSSSFDSLSHTRLEFQV